jgi:hypothetical protein
VAVILITGILTGGAAIIRDFVRDTGHLIIRRRGRQDRLHRDGVHRHQGIVLRIGRHRAADLREMADRLVAGILVIRVVEDRLEEATLGIREAEGHRVAGIQEIPAIREGEDRPEVVTQGIQEAADHQAVVIRAIRVEEDLHLQPFSPFRDRGIRRVQRRRRDPRRIRVGRRFNP